jgi:hypothetical protein
LLAVGSGVTLPGCAEVLMLAEAAVDVTGAGAADVCVADVAGVLPGLVEGGAFSADPSAVTAPAGSGVLNAVPSIAAITTNPATPAASAARRARARLRAWTRLRMRATRDGRLGSCISVTLRSPLTNPSIAWPHSRRRAALSG